MTHDAAARDAGHGRRSRDRVSQEYLGLVDTGPAGDRLLRRIDWMADQAQGPRVLDARGNEGILALLLARRGIEVTAVESDPEAIDRAGELLAKEPAEVRARVELVQGDINLPAPVEGPFDTVILGDILEQADDPAALLDRCLEYLTPEGRAVITIALGPDPAEDHRRALRPTDVIHLLEPRLALHAMEIEDGHIRFVGRLSEDSQASWQQMDIESVLSMTEAALMASQERVRELERQAEVDGVSIAQNKTAATQFKKRLDAKSGEVRVLRHRLQATHSSTSFRAGSAMVQAAKKPSSLLKLPFELLRMYRSASSGRIEDLDDDDMGERYGRLPRELDLDVSQFFAYPPLSIPESRVERPRIAAILDTFTEHSLMYEADLLLLSRDNWRSEIDESRPEFLFVESAFSGNNRDWRHLVVDCEKLEENPLRELVQYCRSVGIPSVFWNKEDPAHFDNFIAAAREFDVVFTSDADCAPVYREALGHDRIHVLPFAAQPRLHNPSREEGWPNHPVCFAGSWVQNRFPEREEALKSLLDPAMPLGLHIFDRNLTRTDLGEHYRFPAQYREAIAGTLTYEEMLSAYRCYDVMLNVNTVTESPTMFSRRVFESLACGTPVVSSESIGMSRMLGEHVRVAGNREETVGHLLDLLGDDEARLREGHLAYRYVHENHTYRHRMDEVFRSVGIEPVGADRPAVSVLMPTMRPENVERCLENFEKQTYENKELVLILNNAEFDLDAVRKSSESIPNVQVLHVGGRATLGECLNGGVEASSGEYVAKMDDDDLYGDRYLADAVLAASFSDADVVGKGAFFTYFEESDTMALAEVTREHTFSFFVTGGTLFIRADVARKNPFDSVSLREDTNFLHAAARAGCRIYSADRFNFVRIRSSRLSDHADRTPDAEFLRKCRYRTQGLDLGRAMV